MKEGTLLWSSPLTGIHRDVCSLLALLPTWTLALVPSHFIATFSVECSLPVLKGVMQIFIKNPLFFLKVTNMTFSMISYSRNSNTCILHLFIQQLWVVYQEPGTMPSRGFSSQQLLLSEGPADALSNVHLTLSVDPSQGDLGSLKRRYVLICPDDR